MKKNDFISIALITVSISLVTYFVANYYFSTATSASVKVKTIETIKSDIVKPDSKIFNKESINPAVQVNIQKATEAQ